MSLTNASSSDTITQLNSARSLTLNDASFYPKIVGGVLPLIGQQAALDLRQWGAEFIAETLASPVINQENKQKVGLMVLDVLKGYVESMNQDNNVLKSSVQASSSLYPHIFRYM